MFDLVLASACISFLLTVGEIIQPKRARRHLFLAGVHFLIGVLLLHSWLLVSSRILSYPWLYMLHIPFVFLMGPLLRAYVLECLDLPHPFRGVLPHIIPFVIILVIMFPYAQEDAWIKTIRILEYYSGNPRIFPGIIFGVGLTHLVGYIFFTAKETNILHVRIRSERSGTIILFFLGMTILLSAMGLSAVLTRRFSIFTLAIYSFSLAPVILFLLEKRFPDFFKDLRTLVEKEKYRVSTLGGLNVAQLKESLSRLMSEEKLYRKEDIHLVDLANELGMTSHQFSEFLNHIQGESFSSFLNRHRVEEAKELLLKDRSRTVLSIAYEVGFNSKSSFHSAFSKFTGMNPQDFRKEAKH